jgi:CTP:molybdopterin cytidylyltransferase MocA
MTHRTTLDVPFVIAAAGRGSRLGFGLPKCLVHVGGRTVLDRQLELLAGQADVRVVVGFRGTEVEAEIARLDRRVRVVENREWGTTNTLASLELATRDVGGRCVIIDGDLVIDPDDFDRFLRVATEAADPCIAITPAGTEDGVFVGLTGEPDAAGRATVTEFRRAPAGGYEWSGLALVDAASLRPGDGWVFSALEPGLPLRAGVVRAWEIDTPADLERAAAAVRDRVAAG